MIATIVGLVKFISFAECQTEKPSRENGWCTQCQPTPYIVTAARYFLTPTLQSLFSRIRSKMKLFKDYLLANITPSSSTVLPTPANKSKWVSFRDSLESSTKNQMQAQAIVKVCEHFIAFIQIDLSDAASLLEEIKKHLLKLKIPLEDMRGQGYDNGANMSGKHNGVQKRILDFNSGAFNVPCAAHTLILALNDAADCCVPAVSFFGIIQELFVFFSGSTKRWQVLIRFVSSLTVKPLSTTRWSSRIDAI